MSSIRALFAAAVLASFATNLHAQASNDNPRASISIVGQQEFHAPAGAVLPQVFSLRVVDRDGVPMQGLAVSFFVDQVFSLSDPPRPVFDLGSLAGVTQGDSLTQLTDADGRASASAYTVGQDPANVIGAVWTFTSEQNRQRVGYPPLVVVYTINHPASDVTTIPNQTPDPAPNGQVAAVAAPTLSPVAMGALLLLLAFVAAFRLRDRFR